MGRHIIGYEVQKVLALVDQYALEDTPNNFFKPPRKVEYMFSFNRGLLGISTRTLDEEKPGFKELHELLTELRNSGK